MVSVPEFLDQATAWAASFPHVRALGLAGSWARGVAAPNSDVDLIVVVDDINGWLGRTDWMNRFGVSERVTDEDWGFVQSRRVHYAGGPEVEFGFTTPAWTALPLGAGTADVIRDGFKILYDAEGVLERAVIIDVTRSTGTEGDKTREDWPSWATEKVEIVQPDPNWPKLARGLAEDLHDRLRAWLDGNIEHVGSTAVPGLPAKPVIDLMAPVTSVQLSHEADSTLTEAGWQLVPPHLDNRPWRRFYVLADGASRVAHLHLLERSSPRWHEVLAFRDALRSRPALVAAYAKVKRAAAEAHPDDREGYTAAKSDFIHEVLTGKR